MVCRHFDPARCRSRAVLIIAVISCLTCVYLGFNGYIVKALSISSSTSYYQFTLGWGFFLFLFYVVLVSVFSAREIAKSYSRSTNSYTRLQLLYFSVGAAISFTIAIFCNLILPALGVTYLSPIGALSPIFALSTISFSITKHRLLDLNVSLKQSAAIGIWIVLLIVPMFSYLAVPVSPSLRTLTSKLVLVTTISLWSVVLYWMVRKGERSFVKLGGERGYVYKSALDALARSLVGVVNSSDVMQICIDYLRKNHCVQGATLWHRTISGEYSVIGESYDSRLAEEFSSYFEMIPVSDHPGKVFIFGKEIASDIPLPPDHLRLCGIIVLPSIKPGTLFITLQSDLGSRILDPVDIELIASFSNYTAAALKSAMQMEQISDLNRFLSEARSALSSYNSTLEGLVEQRTLLLRSQLEDHIAFSEILVHDLSNELNTVAHDLASHKYDSQALRSRLLRLISIIRDTGSFLAAEEMQSDFSACDLTEIVQEILLDKAYLIQGRAVRIVCGELPRVYSQRFSLKQVLGNVIGNALKYVGDKAHPKVEIVSSRETSGIVLRVSDNGIGIPIREVSRVFMPLYRGSNLAVAESSISGSGMGLFIARRLAGNIGIDLEIASEEGVGTEVVVRLPNDAREYAAKPS